MALFSSSFNILSTPATLDERFGFFIFAFAIWLLLLTWKKMCARYRYPIDFALKLKADLWIEMVHCHLNQRNSIFCHKSISR